MIAAAMTQGNVMLRRVFTGHLVALTNKLKQAGVELVDKGSSIRVIGPKTILPVNVETASIPGSHRFAGSVDGAHGAIEWYDAGIGEGVENRSCMCRSSRGWGRILIQREIPPRLTAWNLFPART